MWLLDEVHEDWRSATIRREGTALGHWIYTHRWAFAGDFHDNMELKREIANWFDRENRANAEYVRGLKMQVAAQLVKRVRSGATLDLLESAILLPGLVGLAAGEEVYNAVASVAAGYVDVLRLGQGVLVDQDVKGWGKDALRILSILPVAAIANDLRLGVVGARVQLMARIRPQPLSNFECTTNSAARAFAFVKGKLYAPVMDLWKASGTRPPLAHPTFGGAWIWEVALAMRRLGQTVKVTGVSAMSEVIEAANRNRNGAVLFSSIAGAKGGINHTMMASGIEDGVRVYDTTGTVFRNWAELLSAYPNIRPYQMGIVRGTALLDGLSTAAEHGGLFNALALQVQYAPLLDQIVAKAANLYTEKVALSGPMPKHPGPTPGTSETVRGGPSSISGRGPATTYLPDGGHVIGEKP
jgi:hypothetical protein